MASTNLHPVSRTSVLRSSFGMKYFDHNWGVEIGRHAHTHTHTHTHTNIHKHTHTHTHTVAEHAEITLLLNNTRLLHKNSRIQKLLIRCGRKQPALQCTAAAIWLTHTHTQTHTHTHTHNDCEQPISQQDTPVGIYTSVSQTLTSLQCEGRLQSENSSNRL